MGVRKETALTELRSWSPMAERGTPQVSAFAVLEGSYLFYRRHTEKQHRLIGTWLTCDVGLAPKNVTEKKRVAFLRFWIFSDLKAHTSA